MEAPIDGNPLSPAITRWEARGHCKKPPPPAYFTQTYEMPLGKSA